MSYTTKALDVKELQLFISIEQFHYFLSFYAIITTVYLLLLSL